MRVAHLIKTDGIAGAEAHLLTLLPGLAARGIDVRVVFIAPVSGLGDMFAEAVEAHRIPVERVPIRSHLAPLMPLKLRSVLRQLQPDIAHTHLIHAELYGIPAARLARVPRVVTSRHNQDPARAKQPLNSIYRALWTMTDAGICISESVRRAIIAEGAPPQKLHMIHYGLPPIEPRDRDAARDALLARTSYPPESLLFGTASRLVTFKGISDAIDALNLLRDALPHARLIVAGDGPIRGELEAQVQALGLGERVTFLGWQANAPDVIAGLDVLLSPSYREGFGMTVAEAMTQRTPVIASTTGSLPEIVIDRASGLLTPPKDAAALAEAMRELADRGLRERLGAAGQARVREAFTAERMIEATIALYTSLSRDRVGKPLAAGATR